MAHTSDTLYFFDVGDPPEKVNVFTIRINIDFGGAMPGAYIGAVKAIAKSGADIYRLILI